MDRLLAGDFDPEEYDAAMAAAFDDEYYEGGGQEEEEAELFGAEENAALAALGLLPGGSDDEEEEDGEDGEGGRGAEGLGIDDVAFARLRKQLKRLQPEAGGSGGGGDEEEEEEGGGGPRDPAALAAALAARRAELQRLVEDYYKLDYEESVGARAAAAALAPLRRRFRAALAPRRMRTPCWAARPASSARAPHHPALPACTRSLHRRRRRCDRRRRLTPCARPSRTHTPIAYPQAAWPAASGTSRWRASRTACRRRTF